MIQSGGDPQVGNLATPINSSEFSTAFIRNLPAYRQGLSPIRRGLEVGMAHGYLIYGPFALLGPLRDSDNSSLAGMLSAIGLVVILTICLSIYGNTGSGKPIATLTTPNPPVELGTKEGWSEFATGFFLGGSGGAIVAYFISTSLLPMLNTLG
ncbi:MAG: photosystem I reaction center subunit XI [Prochloraceae cyanobacterium]|nr:photosystem I reaction center subunit XI [Prochloraceae cyanobacterium]